MWWHQGGLQQVLCWTARMGAQTGDLRFLARQRWRFPTSISRDPTEILQDPPMGRVNESIRFQDARCKINHKNQEPRSFLLLSCVLRDVLIEADCRDTIPL